MKCILYYNFFQTLRNKKNYIYGYFIVLFFCFFFLKLTGADINDLLYGSLGLIIENNNVLLIILYILHKIFFLFIAFNLFTYDFRNGVDNFFMRIKPSKWIIFKCLSIFSLTFLFKFIIYILYFLIFNFIFNINIELVTIFLTLLYDISFTFFLQLIFILLYFLFQCNSKSGIVFCLLLLLFVKVIFPEMIIFIKFFELYMLALIIIIFVLYLLYKNKYVIMFERNCD